MSKFVIEAYKGTDGEESNKCVIKVRRRTFHPGVIDTFIKEACEVENYVRGSHFHIWVISKAGLESFQSHLQKFTTDDLAAHFEELRKTMPITTEAKKTALAILDIAFAAAKSPKAKPTDDSDESADDE